MGFPPWPTTSVEKLQVAKPRNSAFLIAQKWEKSPAEVFFQLFSVHYGSSIRGDNKAVGLSGNNYILYRKIQHQNVLLSVPHLFMGMNDNVTEETDLKQNLKVAGHW
jgi:hypothetical protein